MDDSANAPIIANLKWNNAHDGETIQSVRETESASVAFVIVYQTRLEIIASVDGTVLATAWDAQNLMALSVEALNVENVIADSVDVEKTIKARHARQPLNQRNASVQTGKFAVETEFVNKTNASARSHSMARPAKNLMMNQRCGSIA